MSAELKQVGWLSLFEIEDNEESSVKSLSGVFHCTHLRSDAVLQDLRAVASIGLVSLLAFLEPLAVSKTGTNALVPHGVVRKIKSAVCFYFEEFAERRAQKQTRACREVCSAGCSCMRLYHLLEHMEAHLFSSGNSMLLVSHILPSQYKPAQVSFKNKVSFHQLNKIFRHNHACKHPIIHRKKIQLKI